MACNCADIALYQFNFALHCNGRLRQALYLAMLSAARYNPSINLFYDRLRTAGKSVKVARCSAERKLLYIA